MANILDIIKGYLHIFKIVPEQPQITVKPTGYEAQGYGYSSVAKTKEYLKEIKGWAGACLAAIADEVATINLRLYQYAKKGIEEITEHPILDLLYKVNDYTTKFDHFWLTSAYLKSTGEAPWFIDKVGQEIKAIYFLRPDKIVPIVGEDRLISGYEYTIGNVEKIKLPATSVIFLKIPDPANPFRGLGAFQMAARTIDIDNYAEEWNKKFYENSAHPDSILSVKVDQLQEDQLDRLKKSIKDEYGGLKKAHKTMVLFGDMKWEKIGFSQKDMDFLEQQKFSRDKICGILRVPKAILAQTEDVNFASAKTAQYIFARWTIRPEMERLVQQLNEFLLPHFRGAENMFLDYDNPVPDDEESKIKNYESGLKSGWLTINEVREEQGYPRVEGGDSIYLPFGMTSIGKVEGVKEFKLEKKKNSKEILEKRFSDRIRQMRSRNKIWFEVEDLKTEITQKIKVALINELKNYQLEKKIPSKIKSEEPVKNTSKILTIEQKQAFWETKDALTNKYIPEVRDGMEKVFASQMKKTIPKMNRFKAFKLDPNTIYNVIKLDKNVEIKATIKFTMPFLEKLFKEAGDRAFELLELDEEMDITREEIQTLLNINARRFSSATTDYTNEQLKKRIIDGIAEGKNIDELKDSIKDLFKSSIDYRADRIARTEVVRYNASASEQAFIDSEIVEAKEWFVNPGACEFCAPMSGQTVNLGEAFFEKGDTADGREGGQLQLDYDTVETPPLHVNCRCDLVPVFK